MSIFKRIKNLWNLSAIDIPRDTDINGSGLFTELLNFPVKNKQAQVVDMTDVIKDLKL